MRRRTVRGLALVSLAVSGLLATTSCDSGKPDQASNTSASASAPATATDSPSATASPTPSIPATVLPTSFAPAASAGGICTRMTYAQVKSALALDFQIAAASGKAGSVQTCVLMPVDGTLPTLTFVSTPLDSEETVDDYTTDLVPKGASDQDGLGRAAYTRVVAATAGAGPTAEVGWLGTKTAYTLSVTLEPETGVPGATTYVSKLVALAPKLIG